MHADDALAAFAVAATSATDNGLVLVPAEAVAAALLDWPRLRRLEKDLARRVMVDVEAQIGAAAVLEELRTLLPRLVASPTQRGGPPSSEVAEGPPNMPANIPATEE